MNTSPYLLQRNGWYHLRLRIPNDLLKWFQHREFTRSLKTKSRRSARTLCRGWLFRAEKVFTLMRSGMLTDEQIQRLADEFTKFGKEAIESERDWLVESTLDDKERVFNEAGELLEESTFDTLSSVAVETAENIDGELKRGNFTRVEGEAKELLNAHGFNSVPEDSPEYRMLCHSLMQRKLILQCFHIEKFTQNTEGEHHQAVRDILERLSPKVELVSTPTTTIEDQGKLLSDVIEGYLSEKELMEEASEKSLKEYRGMLALCLKLMGDVPVGTINRNAGRAFLERLKKWPKHANKRYGKDTPVEKVLDMGSTDTIAPTRVGMYVGQLSAVFEWAEREGLMQSNPVAGLAPGKKAKQADEERHPYSPEELQAIVNLTAEVRASGEEKHRPERFWVLLIGMYSGMRSNEICQLHTEDVKKVDGVWCFDVNGEGEKTVKNAPSKRLVPIHPILAKLGFLEYVEEMRREGQPRLWMNLTKAERGYTRNFYNWWKKVNPGKGQTGKVFHSLRHNFTTALKLSKVEEMIADQLTGHTTGGMSYGRYGKKHDVANLLSVLEKLDYGLDLRVLGPTKKN